MVIPARTAAAKAQAVLLTSAVVVCGATSTRGPRDRHPRGSGGGERQETDAPYGGDDPEDAPEDAPEAVVLPEVDHFAAFGGVRGR